MVSAKDDYGQHAEDLAAIEEYMAYAPPPEPPEDRMEPAGWKPTRRRDPEKADATISIRATALSALGLDAIPPRRWIYGRELVRGFVSALGAPGGVGKTAFAMAVSLSIVTGRSLFCPGFGPPPSHLRVYKPGAVWFYNLEDPIDEIRRRVKAAVIHHKIRLSDIEDRFFIDSGRDTPLTVAVRNEAGEVVAAPIVPALVNELKAREISVMVVDPFVQSHKVEENNNTEMADVLALWGKVADEANCAIWLVHHFRKGGQAGDGDAFRGASAVQGACRAMSTLTAMSKEEAKQFEIDETMRRRYVRLDDAKANLAPSSDRAVWYHLVSVGLENGDDEYPDGDNVQTVEMWEPPKPFGDMSMEKCVEILERLSQDFTPGEKFGLNSRTGDRWAGHVIMRATGKGEESAKRILKQWESTQLLVAHTYNSAALKRNNVACFFVDQRKLGEMRENRTEFSK